jgi:hypothetical protein
MGMQQEPDAIWHGSGSTLHDYDDLAMNVTWTRMCSVSKAVLQWN